MGGFRLAGDTTGVAHSIRKPRPGPRGRAFGDVRIFRAGLPLARNRNSYRATGGPDQARRWTIVV